MGVWIGLFLSCSMGVKPAVFVCDNCEIECPMDRAAAEGWVNYRHVGNLDHVSLFYCGDPCLIMKLTTPELPTTFELAFNEDLD